MKHYSGCTLLQILTMWRWWAEWKEVNYLILACFLYRGFSEVASSLIIAAEDVWISFYAASWSETRSSHALLPELLQKQVADRWWLPIRPLPPFILQKSSTKHHTILFYSHCCVHGLVREKAMALSQAGRMAVRISALASSCFYWYQHLLPLPCSAAVDASAKMSINS